MKSVPFWIFPVLILFAVGTVWLRLSIVRTSYEVNQADRMIRNANEDLQTLELEVARLRSPQRLEKLAREKFKLQSPAAQQVIRINVQ